MKVRMRSLAASPERVLEAGKVYSLPNETAQPLLSGGFADRVPDDVKAQRIPAQPDPEDTPEAQDVDEDDE